MGWDLSGNKGTNPGSHFLGTTDNQPLVIRTNGAEVCRFGVNGECQSAGKWSGFYFPDRASKKNWALYAEGNEARLWYDGHNKLQLTVDGHLKLAGGLSLGQGRGIVFRAPNGVPWLLSFENDYGARIDMSPPGQLGYRRMFRIGIEGDVHALGGKYPGFYFHNRAGGGKHWAWYAPPDGTARLWSNVDGKDKMVVTQSGDIQLAGADCAEEFDVADPDIAPGTVMVVSESGVLEASEEEYDTRVAGVVSGAGEHTAAIVLDSRSSSTSRGRIALVGKVCCRADASYGSIKAGDPLTTSPTAGHAMKATDERRMGGAVIGKALRPLGAGTGLIPMLLALH